MSKVIKNGTIVTADRTCKADVLIEDEQDRRRSGRTCSGDHEFDATGCYVMPGGIDPHTHLEMPFMGTYSADDFESGTRAALSGGTTMVVDFCLPVARPVAARGAADVGQQDRRRPAPTIPSTWRSPGGASRCSTRWPRSSTRGINTFKHFMAYKGALMVNDDEMYASFQRCAELGALPLVHAENGDVVAALQQKLHGRRQHRARRRMPIRGRRRSRARRPTAPS